MQTNYEFLMEEMKERKLELDHFLFTNEKGKQFVLIGVDRRQPVSIGLKKYNSGKGTIASDSEWVSLESFNKGKLGYKNT